VLTWAERRALVFDLVGATGARRGARPLLAPKLPLPLVLSFVPKLLVAGDRYTAGDALGLPEGLDALVADDQRNKYEAWLRMTFGPGAAKIGVVPRDADDLDAETLHRELLHVVGWLGRDPDIVAQAVELARGWRDLPQAIRGEVLAIAADANGELFERLLRDVRTEPDRTRRGEILRALAGVRDPARVETALGLLLDRALDLRETFALVFATSREATRQVAEKFVRAHRDELIERLPHDAVNGTVAAVAWIFTAACDPARRDEIASYVTGAFATLPGGARLVAQAIETMDQCIATRAPLEPEVRAWLGGIKLAKPKDAKKP